MAATLEEAMSQAYIQLEEDQELRAESSLVKTYLLEAHSDSGQHEHALKLLTGAFSSRWMGPHGDGEVSETKEEHFFTVESHYGRNRAFFYVDATDKRFWLVHSVSRSTSSDKILQRAISQNPSLDSVWLPMQSLEEITRLGYFRGLGLSFDRREVPDVDFETPDAPVEFLKMQVWGNRAGDILRILRAEGAFPEATTLSKVRIKYWQDRSVDTEFSLSDVKYDGKITARGTSFQSHISLVSRISRNYAKKIEQFENDFALRVELDDKGRAVFSGEPLGIEFSRPIENMQIFLDRIFSGAAPFRLSGIPRKINARLYRVAAVDLHVSHSVIFEISPEFMRVYLPKGSCGNSLARLYANLQHYYDSQIQLTTGSGENIF